VTNPKVGTLSDRFAQGSVNSLLWTTPLSRDNADTLSVASLGTAAVPAQYSASLSPSCTATVTGSSIIPVVVCSSDEGVGNVDYVL
jgi:hypothetical protein